MTEKRKNPAAVALGRLGGKAKVPKGFSVLTKAERVANAKRAVKARWDAVRAAKKKAAKPGESEEEGELDG